MTTVGAAELAEFALEFQLRPDHIGEIVSSLEEKVQAMSVFGGELKVTEVAADVPAGLWGIPGHVALKGALMRMPGGYGIEWHQFTCDRPDLPPVGTVHYAWECVDLDDAVRAAERLGLATWRMEEPQRITSGPYSGRAVHYGDGRGPWAGMVIELFEGGTRG